jgi:ribosome-binding factor A
MSQRTERIAGEVRAVVGEVLARQEIKDPRVRGAGLITVTYVRLSGDLRQARALFTVHGAGEAELERVREGLNHASGYFGHAIGARLRMKVTPHLTFEIDRVFEQATKVEELLREIAKEPHAEGGQAGEDGDEHEDEDEDGSEEVDREVDQRPVGPGLGIHVVVVAVMGAGDGGLDVE